MCQEPSNVQTLKKSENPLFTSPSGEGRGTAPDVNVESTVEYARAPRFMCVRQPFTWTHAHEMRLLLFVLRYIYKDIPIGTKMADTYLDSVDFSSPTRFLFVVYQRYIIRTPKEKKTEFTDRAFC